MRRDLDRLAWAWMLLACAVAPVHVALVVLGFREGWYGGLVLPESFGLLHEVGLAALWFSLLGFVVLPVLAAMALGVGVLERRRWSLALAVLFTPIAAILVPPFGAAVALFTVWTLADKGARARITAPNEGPLAWRLGAVVSLHQRHVAETLGDPGAALDLGGVIPESEGRRPVVAWSGRDRVALVDDTGAEHVLDPLHPAALSRGPFQVAVSVVPELRVRRWMPLSAFGSLLWLGIVLGSSVGVQQGEIAWGIVSCPVFGIGCPSMDNGRAAAFTAEYLARLLKEDYAGEAVGVVDPNMQRPDAERKGDQDYIPAGNAGPISRMGGAEEVAPEPVRTPKSEETALPVPKKKQPAKVAVVAENAEPVKPEPPQEEDDGSADAARESPLEEGDAPDVVPEPPAEEKEGWGVQDWYDEQDKRFDDLEIELMIKFSKQRLKIDPNDPGALSILSYYQYLAEDYAAAEGTYDKYIQVLPEDAAGYNNKALIYKRRGEYAKEEGLYRLALAFEPDDVTAMNNLGVNLAHQKRFGEALQVMKRLEVLDPGDPYADLHRSKIYAEMGDDGKALALLEKALQGMAELDTLHHIEFRQDIRLDPSFERLRETERFRSILLRYYGKDSPIQEP